MRKARSSTDQVAPPEAKPDLKRMYRNTARDAPPLIEISICCNNLLQLHIGTLDSNWNTYCTGVMNCNMYSKSQACFCFEKTNKIFATKAMIKPFNKNCNSIQPVIDLIVAVLDLNSTLYNVSSPEC